MADVNLDVNNDKYVGDINDLSGALAQLADSYSKRLNVPGQVAQGAAKGAFNLGTLFGADPISTIGKTIGGAIGGAFGAPSSKETSQQEEIINQIAVKLGLNSDEAKALIESAKIKGDYKYKYDEMQNKSIELAKFLKQPLDESGIILSNTGRAHKNKVTNMVNDIGLDVSDIPIPDTNNNNDWYNYNQQILNKLQGYYDESSGKYNVANIVQPSPEEQAKLKLGASVENKALSLANKTKTPTGGANTGTGIDTSIPTSGSSSLNATTQVDANGNVIPSTVNTSSFNSFLNADDPNAYIGITDPTGKTQTLNQNGEVIPGVQANYQYKDVMSSDKGWNSLDEAGRIAMKKYLYAGNFYGSNDVLNLGSGNLTDADIKAMTSAMAASNINGVDVQSYLKPMYEEFLYTGRPFGEKAVDLNGDGKIDSADANNVTALQSFFKRNGLQADQNYINTYDKAIRSGATTLSAAQDEIRSKMIAPSYAGYADQINQGMDLETIASPYKQKISTMLGIDSSMVDLNDPLLKSMVNNKNADGKPTYTTMDDAEQLIRQDPRWRASSQAQTETANGMYSLMQRFGIF